MNEEDFGAFSKKKKYQNQEEVCYLSRVDESEFGKKNEKKKQKKTKEEKMDEKKKKKKKRKNVIYTCVCV